MNVNEHCRFFYPPGIVFRLWLLPCCLIMYEKSDGEKCDGSVSRRGVENKNRQVILEAHNALRSIVASGRESRGKPGPQPQASNMQIMV